VHRALAAAAAAEGGKGAAEPAERAAALRAIHAQHMQWQQSARWQQTLVDLELQERLGSADHRSYLEAPA
jgi:hypothetical protein